MIQAILPELVMQNEVAQPKQAVSSGQSFESILLNVTETTIFDLSSMPQLAIAEEDVQLPITEKEKEAKEEMMDLNCIAVSLFVSQNNITTMENMQEATAKTVITTGKVAEGKSSKAITMPEKKDNYIQNTEMSAETVKPVKTVFTEVAQDINTQDKAAQEKAIQDKATQDITVQHKVTQEKTAQVTTAQNKAVQPKEDGTVAKQGKSPQVFTKENTLKAEGPEFKVMTQTENVEILEYQTEITAKQQNTFPVKNTLDSQTYVKLSNLYQKTVNEDDFQVEFKNSEKMLKMQAKVESKESGFDQSKVVFDKSQPQAMINADECEVQLQKAQFTEKPAVSVKESSAEKAGATDKVERPEKADKTENVFSTMYNSRTYAKTAITEAENAIKQPQEQTITNQIADNVKVAVSKGKTSFKMKLAPEGLGELTVKMSMENGEMELDINANLPSTKEAISEGLNELKVALSSNNINITNCNVSCDNQNYTHGESKFDSFTENFGNSHNSQQKGNYMPESEKVNEQIQHKQILNFKLGLINYTI